MRWLIQNLASIVIIFIFIGSGVILLYQRYQRNKEVKPTDPDTGEVLLVVFPGRRPKVRAYKMGESWYAHEHDILSDWRVKLLPGGKVDHHSSVIEAWEPVSQNMVEFYHSHIEGGKKE